MKKYNFELMTLNSYFLLKNNIFFYGTYQSTLKTEAKLRFICKISPTDLRLINEHGFILGLICESFEINTWIRHLYKF